MDQHIAAIRERLGGDGNSTSSAKAAQTETENERRGP
jgi:hypothetical protein